MQGLAAVGIGAAAFGAGKLAGGAIKETKRSTGDNIGAGMRMRVSPASLE